MRPDLPEFRKPPVSEVALSVRFAALNDFHVPHFGLLWERFRGKYPHLEEHPPIGSMVGFQEGSDVKPVNLQLIAGTGAVPIRVWFLNEDKSELIQVQNDRFIRNWRGSGEKYPRYEALRELFREDYATFLKFVEQEKFDAPQLQECEVTYVNQIVAGEGWHHAGEAHRVFQVCSLPKNDEEPEPEDFGFAVRYVIRDDGANRVGGLEVTVNSAQRTKDQKPVFVMTLTARGMSSDGFETFFDLGRAWIVKRFAALTTEKMHQIWERQDA